MRRILFAALCAAMLLPLSAKADAWLHTMCDSSHQCEPSQVEMVPFTPELDVLLNKVNTEVNGRYRGVDLPGWDYPKDGKSNCVGYSLTKRRELIERGVPAGAIRLVAVETLGGEPHMVVVVRTDRGDYILDNFESRFKVVLWTKTAYYYKLWLTNTSGWEQLEDTHKLPEWANK